MKTAKRTHTHFFYLSRYISSPSLREDVTAPEVDIGVMGSGARQTVYRGGVGPGVGPGVAPGCAAATIADGPGVWTGAPVAPSTCGVWGGGGGGREKRRQMSLRCEVFDDCVQPRTCYAVLETEDLVQTRDR